MHSAARATRAARQGLTERVRKLTLRARVTLWATSIVAAGLAVASIGLLVGLQGSLQQDLDATARQRLDDVSSLLEHGPLPRHIPSNGGDADVVQVVDSSGRVLADSQYEDSAGDFPHPLPPGARNGHAATLNDLHVGDGGDFRVTSRPVRVEGRPATIEAGVSLEQAEHAIGGLRNRLAVGVPLLTLFVAWTVWGTAGRTLRPVETLRRQTTEISATDLHRRLDLPASQDEVHALARTLNDMLARLETASAAQRRFVADAAHELRSPLTALHAQLELLAHYPDPEHDPQLAAALLQDTERLHDLVEDLLALARSEDPGQQRRHDVVDMDDVLLDEVTRQRELGTVHLDRRAVSAGRVLGDAEALRRVVRNLLDNARRHADQQVRVGLYVRGRSVILYVSDDGSGVPPADRERVFERFTRLDEGRSREAGGSGLGLAIVRKVVSAHGGTARVEADPAPPEGLGGARLVITLPTADTAP